MIKNSSGKILYGMHFYPGLAQYNHSNNDSYKIFLNEDTLRKMDASFSGKPIFVEHVDEVHSDINELRKEADGWVVESFFNSVDGKHWVKKVIVSDRAERAIKNGFRLSNAYIPRLNGRAGQWNGIDYQNEVIDGEYEHLAIVKNPRYEESVIMSPEEYKLYNENLQIELKRIANSKTETKENSVMSKLKFWNRKPVESSIDYENLSVTLPKSGKEYTIYQIVNAMDKMEEEKELKNKKMKNKEDSSQTGLEMKKESVDVEGDLHNEEDDEDEDDKKETKKNKKMKNKEKEDCYENEDEDDDKKDKDAKKKALELAKHEEDEIENEDEDDEEKEDKKMKNKKMKNELLAKKRANFESLRNAPLEHLENDTIRNDNNLFDKTSLGKSRYGSN